MKRKSQINKRKKREITDYDFEDTVGSINPKANMRFEDLGIELPASPPTQVVSIRLPTKLLNQVKALCSEQDVPYQAWIKLRLAEAVKKAS